MEKKMLSKLEGKMIDVEIFGFSQEKRIKIRLKKCTVKVEEWELETNKSYNFFDFVCIKKVTL